MKRMLICLPLAAAAVLSSATANAEAVVREYRVCRDSDGDRVPCGRRYYRTYDGDYSYRRTYRTYDGPGVSVRVGPGRVYRDW